MSFPHFDVFISLGRMAERNLLENMLLTYIFSPDAALLQVFDKTKDQKIMCKDMKESWNSVLNLLVYSKCPINK